MQKNTMFAAKKTQENYKDNFCSKTQDAKKYNLCRKKRKKLI